MCVIQSVVEKVLYDHLGSIDDSRVVAKLERAYRSDGDGKDQRRRDLGWGGREGKKKQSLKLSIEY